MSHPKADHKIVLVTGGNRGIGFAIVKLLAQHRQSESSMVVLMGCRDFDQGKESVKLLRDQGISNVQPLQIDVTSDTSIRRALTSVENEYGRLDVLVNNAGYAVVPTAEDSSDLRQALQDMYNVNVSSVAVLSRLALPLLRRSIHGGKIIQVGSARGSINRLANGELPATVSMGYSVSKTAMNALTLQMSIEPDNAGIEFQIASPGHCKTAFNGYRGTRDPEEGAAVVIELVTGARRETKNWETIGASRELVQVPW